MIWINIANILFENKFSGIARTEYELCQYAYQMKEEGRLINFCTFDERMGFVAVAEKELLEALDNLKNGYKKTKPRPKLNERLKNSTLKRLTKAKINFGCIAHPFQNNDTIITAGQRLGDIEMKSISIIKNKTDIKFKVLCHDLIPINHPEYFLAENTKKFHSYINAALKATDFFYCNSKYTERELLDYCHKNNFNPPPTQVVTLGCDLHTRVMTVSQDNDTNNLMTEPYLIFVSTIEIRKNHRLICDMYLKLIKQGVTNLPKIYFIGRHGWKVDSLIHQINHDETIKGKIVILNNVSDGQLIKLYKNCWFALYPSFIEGYGLPVAECLSMGKYCLSSNAGSLPEAGGEFIDYANPYDIEEWSQKFLHLINNPAYITQKETYIKEHYKPTSWEMFSKSILNNEVSQYS